MVNTSLATTTTRLKKTREERDKFDEASNEILMNLKTKEDDLLKSVASCKVESDVIHTWTNFLEDTWLLQSSYAEQKTRETDDELEKYGKYFVKLISHHVLACKEELEPAISQIRSRACNLKDFNEGLEMMPIADATLPKPQNFLLEEYLNLEAKIVNIFTVIDNMKELLDARQGNTSRGDFDELNKLYNDIERLRAEYRSIERPNLDTETVPVEPVGPAKGNLQKISTHPSWALVSSRIKDLKSLKSVVGMTYQQLDPQAELSKLEFEFQKQSNDNSTEEIEGWEV